MASAGEGEEVLTATAGVAVGLAATGGAVGFSRGAEGIGGVVAGAESGAESEVNAVVVLRGVAIGACTAAGAPWGATGAVEIGRSALASNASPQPGQKRSSLP